MPFIVFGLSGIVAFVLIVPLVKPWFSEARPQPDPAANRAGAPADPTLDSLWAPTPLMLAVATAFAGLSIYGYLGLYPTYLRDALGFTPKQAAGAVSFYGLGALLSLLGGWLGDRYDYRKLLFFSLLISAVAGGLLFTELAVPWRCTRRCPLSLARPSAAWSTPICRRASSSRSAAPRPRRRPACSWPASTSPPLSRATCSAT